MDKACCEHCSLTATSGSPEPPTVSVVIPAYNAAGTIERALNSVYAQTYPSIIEVIVVDDGSQDETCKIIEQEFPQVRLIRQENRGSAIARNHGVKETSGDYVAFLDDDDEWLPHKTLRQMEVFASHPGLVFTLATGQTTETRPAQHARCNIQQITFKSTFPKLACHPGCSGWVMRRSVFDEVGGFRPSMRRAQDVELIWRLTSLGYSTCRLTETLYKYYPSVVRKSAAEIEQRCEYLRVGMLSVVAEYSEARGRQWLTSAEASAAVSYWHFAVAWQLYYGGRRGEARQEFMEAARQESAFWQRLRCKFAGHWPQGYLALSMLQEGILSMRRRIHGTK